MSVYDPNPNTPRSTGGNGGWIAGAVVIILIIVGLFYWGGTTDTASNMNNTPTATSPAPRTTTGSGATGPTDGGPAEPGGSAGFDPGSRKSASQSVTHTAGR